jgi:adenosylcobinamide kinase/adenosylcobinamide-phosphate guanylyltransferase
VSNQDNFQGIELILGGARSGKSSLAEALAESSGLAVTYVATATAGDDEMIARIQQHKEQRPHQWPVIEEPLCLAEVIRTHSKKGTCLLIDCLTLWLTNCLFGTVEQPEHSDHHKTVGWSDRKADFLKALIEAEGRVILVSNEVGQGIVPLGEVSRRFVDESGWLHQAIAKQAERVVFVTAGLPQVLKGPALRR